MSILFVVRTIPVTVLEVDAEVFDRLPLQFLEDARIDRGSDRRRQPDRIRECVRVRRVIAKRALRKSAQLHGGIRLEQMRAAVDRVHGLPMFRLSGKSLRER